MPNFIAYTRHMLGSVINELYYACYTPVAGLEITAWRTPEPAPFAERCSGDEIHPQVGESWGGLFDCAWFRFRGQVPPAASGKPLVALLDVNGEMCVFDPGGEPVRGLTAVASDFDSSLGTPGKRVLPLSPVAQAGAPVEIWADAGCNDLFGRLVNNGVVREACLAVAHPETIGLFYDFEVLTDSLKVMPEQSPRHQQILRALADAVHLLNGDYTDDKVIQARQILAGELSKKGGQPSLQISAIGHAHIDLGWLWPIRETKRKGARTFSTALANMALYPDYRFAASQAQLFQWMKEGYPGLYRRIQQAVKDGRLEPQGALWVECDTNVTGGEALVRQILYGRRYFRQEMGVDVQYVWLPDTFGYTAALPQIIKKAGLKYFSTQKLSWSLVNQFPHQSFHWQGIDGSQVLVHMLPEDTYNGPALPRSIGKIESNYRDSGVSGHALMIYGIGDGGGGPGEEHIERMLRLKNLAGLSPVKQEWTSDFFEKWAQQAERFETWIGEMYLERHEGTLTTHARNKWYNRRMEQALRELEWSACLAGQLTGATYPTERLNEIWREVLLYQFHDILPGSSIKRVYDETTPRYQALLAETHELIQQAHVTLAQKINTGAAKLPVLVTNSLNWARRAWVKLGTGWRMVQAPALGYAVVETASTVENIPTVQASTSNLENDGLRAEFGEDGALLSLFDKANQREIIATGARGNRLAVYRDTGDAWDFPMDYADSQPRHMQLVAARAWVDGPKAVLVQEYALGHSQLTQEISLLAGSRQLEFNTQATWRERQSMLRVSFPVTVQANEASYEIQFGHLRRPTHRNTTWDLARDEVCGQKWADLSQGDYGVALLNDSKYGHKIKGNVIDLNLIRSVPFPGPRLVADETVAPGEAHDGYTDQLEHTFRYALYPHAGGLAASRVVRAGYEFNIPLGLLETETHAGSLPATFSWINLDAESVVIEAVKRAEDAEAWIVRLYESSGSQVKCQVKFTLPVSQVEEADLMEESPKALALQNGALILTFQPFEIKTLKIDRL